jgi:hypothetical protein
MSGQAVESGAGGERAPPHFTVEGLFDYLHETTASLAKVVSARQQSAVLSSRGGRPGEQEGKRLSVHATIQNRAGQQVEYVTEVEVHALGDKASGDRLAVAGASEGRERAASSVAAKLTDLQSFLKDGHKSGLSSFQELVKPLFARLHHEAAAADAGGEQASAGSGDPEDLEVHIEVVELPASEAGAAGAGAGAGAEAGAAIAAGAEAGSPARSAGEPNSGAEEDQPHKSGSRKGRRKLDGLFGSSSKHVVKGKASTAPRPDDFSVYSDANALAVRRFEFEAPTPVASRDADRLLQQRVLDKKMSPSQAAAAAAAGRVLILKTDHGYTFGAAVKRKVSLKPKPVMGVPSRARGGSTGLVVVNSGGPSSGGGTVSGGAFRGSLKTGERDRGSVRIGERDRGSVKTSDRGSVKTSDRGSVKTSDRGSVKTSDRGSVRTGKVRVGGASHVVNRSDRNFRSENTGLQMRPRYIVILYVIPLLLIGIDTLVPAVDHLFWFFRNWRSGLVYHPSKVLDVPLYVRLLWPDILSERFMRDTYRLGFVVMETSGLIVVVQLIWAWIGLFRAVRTRVQVREQLLEEEEEEEEYDEWEQDRRRSRAHKPKNYAYLFRWQPPPPQQQHQQHQPSGTVSGQSLPVSQP